MQSHKDAYIIHVGMRIVLRDRKDGKGYKTMHQEKMRLQDRTKLNKAEV